MRGAAAGSLRLLRPDEVIEVAGALYHSLPHRPGAITRPDVFVRRYLEPATKGDKAGAVVVHTSPEGVDDGYALYSVAWTDEPISSSTGTGEVHELWGADPAVECALWQYLAGIDLVQQYTAEMRPTDDVVRAAARDPRGVTTTTRSDELWLRLLDVETALSARTYRPTAAVSIAVTDPLFADNSDTFEVSAEGVRRIGKAVVPMLRCEIDALSAAYLGSTSWHALASSGRVEGDDADVAAADDLFGHRPGAFCGSFF